MKNLNSSQRSYLKGKAHPLEPIIYIGKNGLSVGTLNAINSALSKRELIKIKFQEFKNDKQKLSTKIADETSSIVVDIIGHTLILFKESLESEKQKYRLPE